MCTRIIIVILYCAGRVIYYNVVRVWRRRVAVVCGGGVGGVGDKISAEHKNHPESRPDRVAVTAAAATGRTDKSIGIMVHVHVYMYIYSSRLL